MASDRSASTPFEIFTSFKHLSSGSVITLPMTILIPLLHLRNSVRNEQGPSRPKLFSGVNVYRYYRSKEASTGTSVRLSATRYIRTLCDEAFQFVGLRPALLYSMTLVGEVVLFCRR